MTLKLKLSRGLEKLGGVPALRTPNSGSAVKPGLLSLAPGHAGRIRPSIPTVTIQSGNTVDDAMEEGEA